jgi:microcystin-dependent protein
MIIRQHEKPLILAHPASTPPADYLECNGAAVSRTAYAWLYGKIGTAYGAGDGSTTFNLPDMRGEFVRGWDNGRGVDAGRSIGSAQGHQMQTHAHGFNNYGLKTFQDGTSGGAMATGPAGTSKFTDLQTGTNGGETRPRNVTMMYCIRYRP